MSATPAFRRWWLETAVAWGLLLDTVVWLDAPDDVLIERIRERGRSHRVKGAPEDQARLFLARHRAAYDATLDVLNRTGTRVIRVDTSTAPASALAAGLAERLDTTAAGHRR
jgi:thymidylate kinase